MGCQTTSSMKNSITFVVGPSQHGLSFFLKTTGLNAEISILQMSEWEAENTSHLPAHVKLNPKGMFLKKLLLNIPLG